MTWAAVAIGGATVVSGLVSSNASKRASKSQQSAAEQANQLQLQQQQQAREDMAPWRNAGSNALDVIQRGLGMGRPGLDRSRSNFDAVAYLRENPDVRSTGYMDFHLRGGKSMEDVAWQHFQDAASRGDMRQGKFWYNDPTAQPEGQTPPEGAAALNFGDLFRDFKESDYKEDPGFKFRLKQGEEAINRNALAAGRYDSGAVLKALQEYNSGLASQEYGNAYQRWKADQADKFNRLAGLAGVGQSATQAGNAAAQNAAQYMGNNMMGAGNAAAAGVVGQANAINSGIGNAMNWWQGQRAVNALRGPSQQPPQRSPFNLNDYNAWADRNT